jgi:hypothetical protein
MDRTGSSHMGSAADKCKEKPQELSGIGVRNHLRALPSQTRPRRHYRSPKRGC